MYKNLSTLVIVISLLLIAALGCSTANKDADVDAFIAELNTTTQEIAASLDKDSSEAGIDAAQKLFDAHQAALQAKWDTIKQLKTYEIGSDASKRLDNCFSANLDTVTGLKSRHAADVAAEGGAAADKWAKLFTGYAAILKPDETGTVGSKTVP